jgi:hypothetical protein
MFRDTWRTERRRTALALLSWLCLANASPGCSPAGKVSGGAEGPPDRLEKMRSLRGTGDPRRQGGRSTVPVRRDRRHHDSEVNELATP